jgi:hypothetical protein
MTNQIECILYTNPLAVRHLDAIGVDNDGSSLIIELSASSVLAAVFDQQNKTRFGLPGLLGRPKRINRIGESFSGMNNPLVLGPRPGVPADSAAGALSLLRELETPYRRLVFLLHLSEVSRFSYSLLFFDRISVLLADSDPTPFSLPSKIQLLAQMQLLDAKSWAGLFYFNPLGVSHGEHLDEERLDVLSEFEGYVRLPVREAS